MPTVNVDVNGRTYAIGCEEGQEDHIKSLARLFDKQVRDLNEQVGSVGELRLFLMAALTTADELSEVRSRLDRLGSAGGGGMLRPTPSAAAAPDTSRLEQRAAAALDEAARRVEALADSL